MPFDIDKALEKAPEAKRAALKTALQESGDFIKELETGYLRQDDYSRKSDEAEKKRKEWEAEKALMETNYAKAAQSYKELLEDFTASSEERDKAKADLEKAVNDLNKHKADNPPIDATKVMTLEQHKEAMNNYAAGQAGFMAQVMSGVYELESLLKKRINPAEIMNGALEAKQTPSEYIEAKFSLKKLKEDADTANKKEHDDNIRKEEREKTISEMSNPATRPLADSKMPFYTENAEKKPVNPWDVTETPADESQILKELTAARG